jgi:AcrR family transcriptional regulator
MPQPTFFNLPAEKRDALVAIALAEFAAHDYATASVSRIVAEAGIAKGSLYQYFNDKQDLFLYLFDLAGRTLIEALDAEAVDGGDDIFALLRRRIDATTRAALRYPLHAGLIRRAYMSPPPFYAELAARGRATSRTYFRRMVEDGIARGSVAADVDPEMAAFILSMVFSEIGRYVAEARGLDAATADIAQFADPAVDRIFDAIMRILARGMASPEAR